MPYLKIAWACARYSVTRLLFFRMDFFIWLVVDFAFIGFNILFTFFLFENIPNLMGWRRSEMLLLIGTAIVINRIFALFFLKNLIDLSELIRRGTLDGLLLKPINPLFYVSIQRIDLENLVSLITGIAIVIYSVQDLHLAIGLGSVALYLAMIGLGVLFHYSFLVILVTFTFWIVNGSYTSMGYHTMLQFSRLPKTAFRGLLRLLLVYLFPIVVVTNIPTNVLRQGVEWNHVAWLAGVVGFWLWIAYRFFNYGLSRYTSASS